MIGIHTTKCRSLVLSIFRNGERALFSLENRKKSALSISKNGEDKRSAFCSMYQRGATFVKRKLNPLNFLHNISKWNFTLLLLSQGYESTQDTSF